MSALAVYGRGLAAGTLQARLDDGRSLELDVERWLGPADDVDAAVLARLHGPVLDVGCGPGRHVRALARRGVLALGVDASPDAVRLARARGTAVVCGSVFGDVPGAGGWGSALLLDGSLGIDGAPERLLRRARELLRPDGSVTVELEGPGVPTAAMTVRLECEGEASAPLLWATVGVDGIDAVARAAAFAVEDCWVLGGRWFAELR